ncbi:MAG TPA: hypothetical protein VGP30_07790 [Candidatus Limnocylindrales bacterium]|nr:hypothetical protein [Candidatus Limnocylindrales bacterium]
MTRPSARGATVDASAKGGVALRLQVNQVQVRGVVIEGFPLIGSRA